MALIAVAGGYTLSRLLKTITLSVYAGRFVPLLADNASRKITGITLCVSVLAGLTAYVGAKESAAYGGSLIQTAAGLCSGGLLFFLLMPLFCRKECVEITSIIRARFSRQRSK
jgi:hypothetical protein